MTRALPVTGSVALLAIALAIGCGSDDATEGDATGGYSGTGGLTGTGAGTAAGGVVGQGGVVATGGSAAGGGPGAGGVNNTGGASNGGSGSGGSGGDGGTSSGGTAGSGGSGGDGGSGGGGSDSKCCSKAGDNCVCRDTPPAAMTSANGKYKAQSYTVSAGCIYYPTDATPPFSAIAISDGLGGSGGCGVAQTGRWGNFLASHGIVTMIVNTGSGDQPDARGTKLLGGIAAFKSENTKSGGQLSGKLNGRYATGGFSMGGGGTTRAATKDNTLLASLGIMAWSPVGAGVTVPTMFICGDSDGLAGCAGHGTPAYNQMPAATPKIRLTITSSHVGQPSAGGGDSGEWGLAFLKLFLDGDERWKPLLLAGKSDATTIK